MANVLLVAYLLIVLALIAVILIQRSEGGGLGMGGGGGSGGGLMSARGSANLLTRTTAILAALFMASAIGLTVISGVDRGSSSILDSAGDAGVDGAPVTILDALNQLQGDAAGDTPVAPEPLADDAPNLSVPTIDTPANTAPQNTGN